MLFKIVAGLLITFSILIITICGKNLYPRYQSNRSAGNVVMFVNIGCIAAFIFAIIFLCFSLMLIQKNYPEKALSRVQKNIFLLLIILYFIPFILCISLFIYMVSNTINQYSNGFPIASSDYSGLAIIMFVLASFIYSMIAAVDIKKQIRLNAEAMQLLEIDSLGQ